MIYHLHKLTPCHPPASYIPYRDEVLAAVRDQRGVFEGATGSRRRAQESQKLLAMLLYTALPPGRTKEFQTLHVAIHDTLPQPVVNHAKPNCLHITADGRRAYLLLGDYKTHKSYGDHFLPLDEGSPLLRHLAVHLNDHRKVLLGAEQHSTFLFLVSICGYMHVHIHTPPPPPPPAPPTAHLLVPHLLLPSAQNERGAPYSASAWTSYIEGAFERHTKKRIGPTLLRSIFVTHCEKSNLSEAEKESMATAMRHSRRAVSKHCHNMHPTPTHPIQFHIRTQHTYTPPQTHTLTPASFDMNRTLQF